MGSLGMRISQDGVDVKTGTNDQMVLTSKYSIFKGSIQGSGTASVEFDGTPTVVTIPHGLGYVPMVQAMFSDPDGVYWNTTNYILMPVADFDGTTEFLARVTADSTNVYLTFIISSSDTIIGYDQVGSLNIDLGSSNGAIANTGTTLVARTGDVCTGIFFYGKKEAANETVAVSLYTVSGGVPVTKVGTGGSINVNSTTAQWWSTGALSDALTDGVEYCVAFGGWGGGVGVENTQLYYDAVGSLSFNSATSLPTTWNEAGTDSYMFSLYATFTRAPIDINYSYTIFIDKSNP